VICRQARRILDDCLSSHESCRRTLTLEDLEDANGVPLPTRVLYIANSDANLTVRLVEPRGEAGRYCALSHCWGGADKRPLCTTKQSLPDHKEGIPFDELPLTFQEAVRLTQALGVDYLWIDSLCIVQDDNDDWLHEAGLMASLYDRAVLVIAAAGSRDSSEGLFFSRNHNRRTLRVLPSTMEISIARAGDLPVDGAKSVYFAPIPFDESQEPVFGPLRERAWATQEWYLARRTLFFMPGGLTWRCKERQCDGHGHDYDLNSNQKDYDSWLGFLEMYSTKKLTRHTDRLMAIHGVARAMETRDGREFNFDYGCWVDSILEQLLWMDVGDNGNPLSYLPSWCWAATGTKKLWLLECQQPNWLWFDTCKRTLTPVAQDVKILDGGRVAMLASHRSLYGEGDIRTCECGSDAPWDRHNFEHLCFPEFSLMYGEGGPDPNQWWDVHVIVDGSRPGAYVGLGIFDGNVPPNVQVTGIFLFSLTKVGRHRGSPSAGHSDSEEYTTSESEEDGYESATGIEESPQNLKVFEGGETSRREKMVGGGEDSDTQVSEQGQSSGDDVALDVKNGLPVCSKVSLQPQCVIFICVPADVLIGIVWRPRHTKARALF